MTFRHSGLVVRGPHRDGRTGRAEPLRGRFPERDPDRPPRPNPDETTNVRVPPGAARCVVPACIPQEAFGLRDEFFACTGASAYLTAPPTGSTRWAVPVRRT